jgi:hypothetical protein
VSAPGTWHLAAVGVSANGRFAEAKVSQAIQKGSPAAIMAAWEI